MPIQASRFASIRTKPKVEKVVTHMSAISHRKSFLSSLPDTSGNLVDCHSTNQSATGAPVASSPSGKSGSEGKRLVDQLAFANREAARTAPSNRTDLFPATFNPQASIRIACKPRGELIRSQLAKSLSHALANLS